MYSLLPHEDNVISFQMCERLTFACSACKTQCRAVRVTIPITNVVCVCFVNSAVLS